MNKSKLKSSILGEMPPGADKYTTIRKYYRSSGYRYNMVIVHFNRYGHWFTKKFTLKYDIPNMSNKHIQNYFKFGVLEA